MAALDLRVPAMGRQWTMTADDATSAAAAVRQEAFVRDHYPKLVASLSLLVGDSAWAEELAHEAFIKAFTKFDTLDDVRYPSAWLFRVGSNLAKSTWRRRQAERRATIRLGAPSESEVTTDPAEVLAVREALGVLPARQRAVIICRYFSGLSVTETAQALEVAEGTVKSLTHQAIRTLRSEMGVDVDGSERTVDLRPRAVSHE
jgi:RNA polymerase sigma factor (sigma-70 family)